MKTFTLSLAITALFAFASTAQAQTVKTKAAPTAKTAPAKAPKATNAAAATSSLSDYAGVYAVENLPFEEMSFSVKEGKLWVKAGENEGPVTTLPEADSFDGGQAIFHFKRDESKKVVGLAMEAAGITFEGTKK